MSYTITVSGHKAGMTPEEESAFEEGIRAKAQTFAASLEGVNGANMQGASIGYSSLMPEPAAAPPAEGEATPGV